MARLSRFYSELSKAMLGVKQQRATTAIAQSPALAQTTTTTNTSSKTRTQKWQRKDKDEEDKDKQDNGKHKHKSKRGKPISNSCNTHLTHYYSNNRPLQRRQQWQRQQRKQRKHDKDIPIKLIIAVCIDKANNDHNANDNKRKIN